VKTAWTMAACALALALSGCAADGARPEPVPGEVSLDREDTDGKRHDLEGALARGETVAFVFWQTWCESCAEEAPLIKAAAAQEQGKIHFVGVVPGKAETVDEAEVEQVRARWGYDFPQLRDADMSLTKALGVKGTPTIVVLGSERTVLYHAHRPPADWASLRGKSFAASDEPGAELSQPDLGGQGAGAECKDGVCPLPANE